MASSLGALPSAPQRGRRRQTSPVGTGSNVALQAAALLLTRPWLAKLPLVDEGAGALEQEGTFTEVCVLAIRWAGPAVGAISNCIVAVPAAAISGLQESFETFSATLHVDGPASEPPESCEIVVLYFDADFIRSRLAESTPSSSQVIAFSSIGTGGMPIGADICEYLDLPEEFSAGTLAKTRVSGQGTTEVIVYDLEVNDEENYITAVSTAEDEPVNPLVVLSDHSPNPGQQSACLGGYGHVEQGS
eukprot:1490331-Amphidinium_carterae.1